MSTLHPSGFVESAGSCSGPRYIRSQPSRETPGVLLNECEAKYIPAFELPYRNITRYIKEIQDSWDKINPNDKEQIYNNLLKNLPQLKQQQQIVEIQNQYNIDEFISSYLYPDPYKNTQKLLNKLYNDNSTMPISAKEEITKSIRNWVEENFHPDTLLFLFVLLLITCVILVAFYQNKK